MGQIKILAENQSENWFQHFIPLTEQGFTLKMFQIVYMIQWFEKIDIKNCNVSNISKIRKLKYFEREKLTSKKGAVLILSLLQQTFVVSKKKKPQNLSSELEWWWWWWIRLNCHEKWCKSTYFTFWERVTSGLALIQFSASLRL